MVNLKWSLVALNKTHQMYGKHTDTKVVLSLTMYACIHRVSWGPHGQAMSPHEDCPRGPVWPLCMGIRDATCVGLEADEDERTWAQLRVFR